MQFRVLGRFEVISDTGEPLAITRPQVRGVIFALTLYRNTSLPPDRMVELLWGTAVDAARVHSLRNCIWDTRQMLPTGRLITDDIGYRLRIDAEDDQVDVDRFRELQRHGAAALRAGDDVVAARLLDEAVRMWGSAPLGELLPATPAMISLVAALADEHREARTALIQARLALGEHHELVPELRALLAGDPADEQTWAALMLALYRCGRKADALRAFQEACAAVAAHADAEPGPELRALRRRIVADDPALISHGPVATVEAALQVGGDIPPRQLPPDPAGFTGRAGDAAEVIGRLSPGAGQTAVRVAQLAGPPGVGKTALAVHVGHAVAHDFPDGQLYVPMAGTSPTPPSTGVFLGEVLGVLGLPAAQIPATTPERAAAYRARLAGRRMLIVLDDAACLDQVRPLLPGAPGCAVIVTSRARLTVPDAGGPITVSPLPHAEGRELLARLIGRARVAAEPQAAGEVVDACGGFPLAIRIAGQRLAAHPAWPIAHLARALRDGRHRLDALTTGDLQMRRSLAASYRTLGPQAQRLFRLLALAGPYPVAGWVGDVLLDEPAAEVIDTLIDQSLLAETWDRATGQPRYRLHDLLQDYAGELLAGDPDAQVARERLHAGWLELADVADTAAPGPVFMPGYRRPPSRTGVVGTDVKQRVAADPKAWFAAERTNLRLITTSAEAAGDHRTAQQLALRLTRYLHGNADHDEAERIWTAVTKRDQTGR
jgi:DNA-binding SARP family transcriptional activator